MRFSHPNLPKKWNVLYAVSKVFILIAYVGIVITFILAVLFPSQVFRFDFRNPKASKNTITEPRDGYRQLILNGKTTENASMLFDVSIDHGEYDTARIHIAKETKSARLTGDAISAQKSYRAFLYPEATDALQIPMGTLIRNNNDYFIIDKNGSRIAFSSLNQVVQLGFDPEAFTIVSESELQSIPQGTTWENMHSYPEGSLFLIDTTYYQLEQNTLRPFVSDNAFFSKHTADQAIRKGRDFFSRYQISDDWIGFQDASLLSFADGVFIVDTDEIRPIGSISIFESLGLNWDDVTPVSEEEIGIYKRGKIVLQNTPHPDGTVFFDTENQQYYVIGNNRKYRIPDNWLLHIYLKDKHPIAVSEKSSSVRALCALSQQWFFSSTYYTCDIPLKDANASPGNTFMFSYTPDQDTDIQNMSVTLKSVLSWNTSHQSLAQIKQRILNRFGYEK
jgi:hypothetical protein